MRIVFMGTSIFALPALQELAIERDVVAVYTKVDSQSKRGGRLHPSPVKDAALELGIPVLQPTTLKDPHEIEVLERFAPDAVIVAAYGLILPPEVLAIPRFGCINIHGSLLPRWRGAAPIQRAILAGDKTSGISIMRMDTGLDTGPVCDDVVIPIEDTDDYGSLTDKLSKLGAAAVSTALAKIERDVALWVPQNEENATYAKKILKEEVLLDPAVPASMNLLRVRASSDQAPARFSTEGVSVRVLTARLSDAVDVEPGHIETCARDGSILLGCSEGAIELLSVKPQGKQAMDATAWARGIRALPHMWERIGGSTEEQHDGSAS